MLCLRCAKGVTVPSTLLSRTLLTTTKPSTARTFTSLTTSPLRPTVPTTPRSTSLFTPIQPSVATDLSLSNPAVGATQIRCAPRNTFSPSHFVRKRRHGFLSRLKSRKGRATLQRRREKKRSTLSH